MAAKGSWFEVKSWETGQLETKSYNIYKDPVTDDGTKKSLKGLLAVSVEGEPGHENIFVVEECTPEQENQGLLQVIYEDGKFYNETSLTEIRERLQYQSPLNP
jgi:nicotinic acid phosphoribosyltransferase